MKLLGQKIKDTLTFNHRVVAQNVFTSCSSKLSNHVRSTPINHQAQTYIKQTNKHTKNKAPIKKETLKERTKGRARSDGSLKNTKCAWKGKAWLTLKR
jgi:hypothetical protein